MNTEQLFSLRKEGGKDFGNILELRPFLEGLFEQDLAFPVVKGSGDYPKGWKVVQLQALNQADKLTIQLYLEALKAVEADEHHALFNGSVIYHGLDDMDYTSFDLDVLSVGIRQRLPLRERPQEFLLKLYYSDFHPKGEEERNGYAASSSISETHLEKLCSRFKGPNRNYHPVLL